MALELAVIATKVEVQKGENMSRQLNMFIALGSKDHPLAKLKG
jgi:hypothetical protein